MSKLSRADIKEYWERHLAEWSASGLTQAGYCRLNKICLKSFQYWKRKSKQCGVPALVELPLFKSTQLCASPSSPQLCVVVGQQYRIEIGKGFDSEDLERLVRVLERI